MVKNADKITPPDTFHLNAACGWLELGNAAEAATELANISKACETHPDVLELKWQIWARMGRWDKSLSVAQTLCDSAPDRPQSWLHQAVTLYRLKRTQEAWDVLLPLAEKFPGSWVVSYDLSCYACQLGHLNEARSWLRRAFSLAGQHNITAIALADPDLELVWPEIRAGAFNETI